MQATAFAGAAAGMLVTVAALRLRMSVPGAHAALLAPAMIVVAVLLVIEDATGRGGGRQIVADLMAAIRGAVEAGNLRLEDLVIFAAAFWTICAFFVHATVAGSPRIATIAPLVAALAVTVIDPAEASWWRISGDVAMVGAVLVAAALDERAAPQSRFRPADRRHTGRRWVPYPVMASGFALAAIVLAVTVAPLLSMVGTEAKGFPLSGGGAAPGRSGFDHFVDIHQNLTDLSDVPLFQVDYDLVADVGQRLRLLTMSRFDRDGFGPGDPGDDTIGRRDVGHRVRILRPFDGAWLPAVPGATSATAPAVVVAGGVGGAQSAGLEYRVTSRPLSADGPAEPAPSGPPRETETLDGLADPEAVAAIARDLAAGSGNDLEAMVAIEGRLRGRTYQLPLQRSEVDLVSWLGDDTAAGYCEQFAVGMAVLARSLGVPSRVVVGFLPGSVAGTAVTVTGGEAHAWVEAWIEGVGWLPFDPTPGERSGAALGASYRHLDVAEQESETPAARQPAPDPPAPPNAAEGFPSILVAAAAAVAAVLATLAGRAFLSKRARRRRAAAGDVVAAWDAIVTRLGEAGMAPQPWATPFEIARSTTSTMHGLAAGFTKHAYGTAVLDRVETDLALDSMRRTDAELLSAMSPWRRLLAVFGAGRLSARRRRGRLNRWRPPRS